MGNYTFGQLETIWTEGGGASAMAPIMAAIALAESSGNPTVRGPSYAGDAGSWGLWQIQPSQHPSMAYTSDPVTQARYANQILQQQGLSAWSTYTSGAYKKYYTGSVPSSFSKPTPAQQQAGPPGQVAGASPPPQPVSTPFLTAAGSAGACKFAVGQFCADTLVGMAATAGGGIILVICAVVVFRGIA